MTVAVRKICQVGGFLWLVGMCFLALSIVSYSANDPSWHHRVSRQGSTVENLGGIVGASLADMVVQFLGSGTLLLVGMGCLSAWCMMRTRLLTMVAILWRGSVLLAAVNIGIYVACTTDPIFGVQTSGGGLLGREIAHLLVFYVSVTGTYLVIGSAAILALFVGVEYRPAVRSLYRVYLFMQQAWRLVTTRLISYAVVCGRLLGAGSRAITRGLHAIRCMLQQCMRYLRRRHHVALDDIIPDAPSSVEMLLVANSGPDVDDEFAHDACISQTTVLAEPKPSVAPPRSTRKKRPTQRVPSLDLLDRAAPAQRGQDPEVLETQARFLEQKLLDFGVDGEVVQVLPGPVITMYEFAPAPGIKVSKIVNLQDDLALGMRALSVRVVAPIPGKAVVGIEIPNQRRETVRLRELLDSEQFRASTSQLTLALGKDILGKPVVTDLASIPHLLIAGATGSGKSVGLNSMICSLLFRATPSEVRMIMIDPKMLELSIYDGIPHLLVPVVTHPKQAAVALRRVVQEMERRYQLLATRGVRSIAQYNEVIAAEQAAQPEGTSTDPSVIPAETLPYLVVIIDELSDLMMVSSREVEDALTRIAQMARAAGIHLIVATQRPSVDVLTGVIKANFPARVSFQVSSKTDSRTILDANGAEKLLGRGDMLFLAPGTSKPRRIHGAYVSEAEINRLVAAWKDYEQPQYDESFLEAAEDAVEIDEGEYDEKYDEAVALVARIGQASISMLQRRLRVGYNRAARMIETMEREGVIGPADGVKPREVLVRKEYED